jgi:hypothetical protein
MGRASDREQFANDSYESFQDFEEWADLDEAVKCPYCGNWTKLAQLEAPSDQCHHDVLKTPIK